MSTQRFCFLVAASDEFEWSIDFACASKIKRAWSIIRSALLDDIASAISSDLPEGEMISAALIHRALPGLRRVVRAATTAQHVVPTLATALKFIVSYAPHEAKRI